MNGDQASGGRKQWSSPRLVGLSSGSEQKLPGHEEFLFLFDEGAEGTDQTGES